MRHGTAPQSAVLSEATILPPAVKEVFVKFLAFFDGSLRRERDRIRVEIQGIQGLLPLLMKQRNGYRWTTADRAQLRSHLRNLTSLGPYLLVILAPGSFLLLPLLAWWLDRRRQKRPPPERAAPLPALPVQDADRSSPPANP